MKIFLFFVVLLQVLRGSIGHGEAQQHSGSDQIEALSRRIALIILGMAAQMQNELKFPTKCGYTPFHSRAQIASGNIIQPDEYSWMASLQYKNPNINISCSGSVINSRYVLTAGHCVTGPDVEEAGGLIGVRLGEFDKNGSIQCDYGSNSCTHYQLFGIENFKLHEEFNWNWFTIDNDIALIRLNRMIEFGLIRPICLPFGSVHSEEPNADSIMTVAGWGRTMEPIEIKAKRDAIITLWSTDRCNKTSRKLCAVGSVSAACMGDSGGPLMSNFKRHHMVLEGIVSYGNRNCTNTKFPGVFTRVRSYFDWLDRNMYI